MEITKILAYIFTVVILVALINVFWPLILILLLALAVFLAWTYYRAKKTINQWQNEDSPVTNSEYEDTPPSNGEVIEAEYKEKEIK